MRLPWPFVFVQLAAALSNNESSSGKESALAAELAAVRSELSEALTEKSELEEALGLMEKNNLAQVAALQVWGYSKDGSQ